MARGEFSATAQAGFENRLDVGPRAADGVPQRTVYVGDTDCADPSLVIAALVRAGHLEARHAHVWQCARRAVQPPPSDPTARPRPSPTPAPPDGCAGCRHKAGEAAAAGSIDGLGPRQPVVALRNARLRPLPQGPYA
jgi:hypothetical protein